MSAASRNAHAARIAQRSARGPPCRAVCGRL